MGLFDYFPFKESMLAVIALAVALLLKLFSAFDMSYMVSSWYSFFETLAIVFMLGAILAQLKNK